MIMYCYLRKIRSSSVPRIRDNTSSLPGFPYTLELLEGSNTQCQEMMRLSRVAYIEICNHFKQLEEKMAIFLHVISHNDRVIKVKRRFQHATHIVHKYFSRGFEWNDGV
ncbi:hypothetical protein DCAR_0205241 [Daucus carota subsp. sativus]|uniref:DUF8040 domain-containing protein n=1 Tax=Daucus carota subsp. sativus TaxID=79200 RepID=A0AAF0W9Y5_DAUCS|nr:hypothetical protein DCAR_0205241 [Daucus carota subsp. sativus]